MSSYASGRRPSGRTPTTPARRVPAPTARAGPRRSGGSKPSGKVAARSAEQAADRELTAWFEKAAAETAGSPTETSFGKLGLPRRS